MMLNHDVRIYKLKDDNEEEILVIFYEYEIMKINYSDEYWAGKVFKTKRDKESAKADTAAQINEI